jgi:hypothetical protein
MIFSLQDVSAEWYVLSFSEQDSSGLAWQKLLLEKYQVTLTEGQGSVQLTSLY